MAQARQGAPRGHTPGPWTVGSTFDEGEDCTRTEIIGEGWVRALVIHGGEPEVAKANAALIASAPALALEVGRLRDVIRGLLGSDADAVIENVALGASSPAVRK